MGLIIGTMYVRRSIYIEASPERVWQEFIDFDRLNRWFGKGHQLEAYEPLTGTTVTLSVEIDGERRAFGGSIVVFDVAQELSFESNWHPPYESPVPTFFTIRLTPLYEGTQVEIFHHGFERFGAEAADNLQDYESGWTVHHLTALRSLVTS